MPSTPATGPLHLLLPLLGIFSSQTFASFTFHEYLLTTVCHFLISFRSVPECQCFSKTSPGHPSRTTKAPTSDHSCFILLHRSDQNLNFCVCAQMCSFKICLLLIFPTKMWAPLDRDFILFPAIFPLLQQSLGWVGTQYILVTCMNKLSFSHVPRVLLMLSHVSHILTTVSAHCPHFTGEETEVEVKWSVTQGASHKSREWWAEI